MCLAFQCLLYARGASKHSHVVEQIDTLYNAYTDSQYFRTDIDTYADLVWVKVKALHRCFFFIFPQTRGNDKSCSFPERR